MGGWARSAWTAAHRNRPGRVSQEGLKAALPAGRSARRRYSRAAGLAPVTFPTSAGRSALSSNGREIRFAQSIRVPRFRYSLIFCVSTACFSLSSHPTTWHSCSHTTAMRSSALRSRCARCAGWASCRRISGSCRDRRCWRCANRTAGHLLVGRGDLCVTRAAPSDGGKSHSNKMEGLAWAFSRTSLMSSSSGAARRVPFWPPCLPWRAAGAWCSSATSIRATMSANRSHPRRTSSGRVSGFFRRWRTPASSTSPAHAGRLLGPQSASTSRSA